MGTASYRHGIHVKRSSKLHLWSIHCLHSTANPINSTHHDHHWTNYPMFSFKFKLFIPWIVPQYWNRTWQLVKRWSSLPGSFNDVRVPTLAIHWSIELIGNWMSNYYEWMNSDTTSLSFLHTDPPCYDHRLTLCLGMDHFFILIQCY